MADPASLSDRQYADLLAFRVALRRFLHWSEQAAASEGLTPAQHQLLLAVRGHAGSQGPTCPTSLATCWCATTARWLIDRAEAMGFVVRRADAEDQRVVRVRLTARGRRRLDALTTNHLDELRRVRPVLHALLGEDLR